MLFIYAALVKRISTGKTDRGILYTNEGMTIHDGKLNLLPEDGHSRLLYLRRLRVDP